MCLVESYVFRLTCPDLPVASRYHEDEFSLPRRKSITFSNRGETPSTKSATRPPSILNQWGIATAQVALPEFEKMSRFLRLEGAEETQLDALAFGTVASSKTGCLEHTASRSESPIDLVLLLLPRHKPTRPSMISHSFLQEIGIQA